MITNKNLDSKMEKRKRHAWDVACQTVVVTREDALQVYQRLMEQFEIMDPIGESHKTY
jgi:hypothetical protein